MLVKNIPNDLSKLTDKQLTTLIDQLSEAYDDILRVEKKTWKAVKLNKLIERLIDEDMRRKGLKLN